MQIAVSINVWMLQNHNDTITTAGRNFYVIVVVKSIQIKSNLFVTHSNKKYGLSW